MTAARYVSDAGNEALKLANEIDALTAAVRAGQKVSFDELVHFYRVAVAITYNLSRASHTLSLEQEERRAAIPRLMATLNIDTVPVAQLVLVLNGDR